MVAYDVNVWKTKNLSQYYHDDVVHESHYADILYKTLISTRDDSMKTYIVHSSSRCCRVDVESRYWSHLIVVHGTLACDMM